MRSIAVLVSLLLVCVIVIGCGGGGGNTSLNPNPTPAMGKVTISLPLPDSSKTKSYLKIDDTIASATVTVTGPQIKDPIIQDLTYNEQAKAWQATFEVPCGNDRLFSLITKNATGENLYSGSSKNDIKPGQVNKITIEAYWDYPNDTLALNIKFD